MLGSWLVGWGRATSVHWVASLSNTGVEISASSHCKAGRNIMLECKPEITRVQNTGTRCFWNKAGVAARPDNGQVKTGIRSSGDWGHVLPERPWASNPISLSLTFCRGCHFCKMRLLNGSNGRMNVKGTKTAYAFPRWVSSFYRSQTAPLNKPHIHHCCDPSWHLPGLEETRSGHSEVWSPTPLLSFPSGVGQHFCASHFIK